MHLIYLLSTRDKGERERERERERESDEATTAMAS